MWDALSIVKLFTPFVPKNATQVYLYTDVYIWTHFSCRNIRIYKKSRSFFGMKGVQVIQVGPLTVDIVYPMGC
jgi:hypothetical protein